MRRRRDEPDSWTLRPGATRTTEKGEKVYIVPDPAEVAAIYRSALVRGTHGGPETFLTVCDGCRNWVSWVYWISPSKTRLCKACAPPDRKKS